MPSWPSTLPQRFVLGTESYEVAANTVSAVPEVGTHMIRRRFTGKSATLSGSFIMTATEADAFWTFYRTTLTDGALSFTWYDPENSSGTADYVFTGQPIAASGANSVNVSISLRRVS